MQVACDGESHHEPLLLDIVHAHGSISFWLHVRHLHGHGAPLCRHVHVVLRLCMMVATRPEGKIFRFSTLWPTYTTSREIKMWSTKAGIWVGIVA